MKSRVKRTFTPFAAEGENLPGEDFLRFFPKTSPSCGTIRNVGLDSRVTIRIVPQKQKRRVMSKMYDLSEMRKDGASVLCSTSVSALRTSHSALRTSHSSSVLTVQCCGRDTKRKTNMKKLMCAIAAISAGVAMANITSANIVG